jgi:FAD/FMN-containing dehydrogenase
VSLPWKSELVLRLERSSCSAQLRGGWSRRIEAQVRAAGTGPASIVAAVQALRARGATTLPRGARLMLPDEHVYLALRPASGRRRQALLGAAEHFSQLLDRQDIDVQVSALPDGSGWLAAAVDRADLQAWRDALRAEGLTLQALQLGLIDDLRAVARHVGERAIVALMREEGMTLMRLAGSAPVDLQWERCDQHALGCIEQRLLAYQRVDVAGQADPLVILCRSEAQREALRKHAAAHRWTLLLRGAKPWHPLSGFEA